MQVRAMIDEGEGRGSMGRQIAGGRVEMRREIEARSMCTRLGECGQAPPNSCTLQVNHPWPSHQRQNPALRVLPRQADKLGGRGPSLEA